MFFRIGDFIKYKNSVYLVIGTYGDKLLGFSPTRNSNVVIPVTDKIKVVTTTAKLYYEGASHELNARQSNKKSG